MATVVAQEAKEKLIALGLWGDFVRRREDLRSDGSNMTATAANRAVMSEFVAAGKVPSEMLELVRGPGRPSRKIDANQPIRRDVIRANRDEREEVVATDGGVVVEREMFSGKRCSIYTAFMWAYENLRFSDVRPEEAPSAVAWNMMQDMRASPSLKADWLRAGISKAMARTDEDDAAGKRFDGEGEYDLLGVLAREASA